MSKKKNLQRIAKQQVEIYNKLNNEVHAMILKVPEYQDIIDVEFARAYEPEVVDAPSLKKTPNKKLRGVIFISVTAFTLHATGLDMVLLERGKQNIRRAQLWWNTIPEPVGEPTNGKHEKP